MSTTTTNYGLVKPELTDAADITAMNTNWDKIDSELKNASESDIFIATYGETTNAEIELACQAGKAVFCAKYPILAPLAIRVSSISHIFYSRQLNKDMKCVNDTWSLGEKVFTLASDTHASTHAIGGSDPITPESIGAAPAYTYGTTDLTAGTSNLTTGTLYFVYE